MIEKSKVKRGDEFYFFSQKDNKVEHGFAFDDGKNCPAGFIHIASFGDIPCEMLHKTISDCLHAEHAQAYFDAFCLRNKLKVVNKRRKTIELLAQKYGVFL